MDGDTHHRPVVICFPHLGRVVSNDNRHPLVRVPPVRQMVKMNPLEGLPTRRRANGQDTLQPAVQGDRRVSRDPEISDHRHQLLNVRPNDAAAFVNAPVRA